MFVALEIVLADGRIETIGVRRRFVRRRTRRGSKTWSSRRADEIAERMPPGLLKRWPGYGIPAFSARARAISEILAGSEGTLAAIFSAELKISSAAARERSWRSSSSLRFAEAMQATVELLDLKPSAIEHIDRPLFDQTKGQLLFQVPRAICSSSIRSLRVDSDCRIL